MAVIMAAGGKINLSNVLRQAISWGRRLISKNMLSALWMPGQRRCKWKHTCWNVFSLDSRRVENDVFGVCVHLLCNSSHLNDGNGWACKINWWSQCCASLCVYVCVCVCTLFCATACKVTLLMNTPTPSSLHCSPVSSSTTQLRGTSHLSEFSHGSAGPLIITSLLLFAPKSRCTLPAPGKICRTCKPFCSLSQNYSISHTLSSI